MKIVRGQFSHGISEDLRCLAEAFLINLNKKNHRREFEREFANYVGRGKCLSFPFARTALYFTLKSLDLKPGDRILMPSITIKAMLDVVMELELEPIFVDSDPSTACLSIEHLDEILDKTKNIKVCFLTYLFGAIPDISNIASKLHDHKIIVIEDFSQNLNGQFDDVALGAFGDFSIYSSSAVKTLDLHGGGHVFGEDEIVFARLEDFQNGLKKPSKLLLVRKILKCSIKNIATSRLFFSMVTFPIIKLTYPITGHKTSKFVGSRSKAPISHLPVEWFYAFTEAQAKFGLRALRNVSENDEARIRIAARYNDRLRNIDHVNSHNNSSPKNWQYIVYPEDPDEFRRYLSSNGIDSAQTSLINLSNLPLYGLPQNLNAGAEFIFSRGVYIPIYKKLKESEVEHIIQVINSYNGTLSYSSENQS